MPADRTCPSCGSILRSDALEGLCPTCVGRAAFCNDGTAGSTGEIEAEFARLKPEEVGQWIGSYRLMDQIGQGGFGTVWVADQERPVRRQVALKIVKLGMDTKEVIARFEQERQALALMDHPNIAKVFDAGATQWGRPFFVMELVHGIKITEYCDQANLPTAERLALFIQVCHAVQHAHQKGIIHRDLKPSNILVTLQDGVPLPKIIDFGIAKAIVGRLTDATVYTQLNQFIGTPAYMSPEQAEMTFLDVDTRSDLYSLGVLLYELLVGQTPFDQETLMRAGLDEMRRVIREQEPQKPSTALQTMAVDVRARVAQRRQTDGAKMAGLLSGDLDWIVMKALEKDRTRRYETATEFAQDIRRHLASEPVTAAAPSVAYLCRKFARRNRLALAVGTLVAVMMAAATCISLWQASLARSAANDALKSKKDANDRADAERVAREDSEAIMKLFVGVFQSPDPGVDGRKITVAETFEKAVKKFESDLATRPARRAQLQYTLGTTYSALSLPRDAIPLLESARDYFISTYGNEHPETLKALHNLAKAMDEAGRGAEALKLREEIVPISRKVLGLENRFTLLAMRSLGISLYGRGKRREALKLREELLPLFKKVNGPEDPETLTAMNNLAISLADAGRGNDALALNKETLELSRKVLGAEHPDSLALMNNTAVVLANTGHVDEALTMGTEALSLTRRVMGAEHSSTLLAMNSLASIHREAGHKEESLKQFEELLELRQKVSGPEHAQTLGILNNVAMSHYEAGQREAAISSWRELLPLMRKVRGPSHPNTLLVMQNMALALFELGQKKEALQLREDALPLSRNGLGPENPETLMAMYQLARSYSDAGRNDEALKLLKDLLPLSRKVLGADHADTIDVIRDLAASYALAGDEAEAQALRKLVPGKKTPGVNVAPVAAPAPAKQGVKALEEALENVRNTKGKESADTIAAMTLLAAAVGAEGSGRKAIMLAEEALAIGKRTLPAGDPHITEAMKVLIPLYRSVDLEDDARKLEVQMKTFKGGK